MAGIFGGVADAKVNKTGNYFLTRSDGGPGRYMVEIQCCKTITSQRDRTLFAVIEGRVKASTVPEVKVGDERTQLIEIGTTMGPINLRKFVAAALGVDPYGKHDDVTIAIERAGSDLLGRRATVEAVCEWIFGDENPLGVSKPGESGVEVGLETKSTKTKKGSDFTVHEWHPADGFTV